MIRSHLYKRSLFLGAIIIVATLILMSDALFGEIEAIIKVVESLIFQFPVFGKFIFIVLAMVSAMLAFYSSAILVPIGIFTWGAVECFILLWIGWLLGGILSFTIGYYLGRPLISTLIGNIRFSKLENKINRNTKFIFILLFQAALPSEVPGYVLGALHYRFYLYCMVLIITELPYALGTIYIGENFLRRDSFGFLILGVCAIATITFLHYLYRRHFHMSSFTKSCNINH